MFKPISHLVNWNERRLTPAGTKVFGGTSNRSPSTSLKTTQELVFLPRRLKTCARKAAYCSASQRCCHPERKKLVLPIPKCILLTSFFICITTLSQPHLDHILR